jgi:hypothetical protein
VIFLLSFITMHYLALFGIYYVFIGTSIIMANPRSITTYCVYPGSGLRVNAQCKLRRECRLLSLIREK